MKIAFLVLAHSQIELVYRQIHALTHPGHHFFIHLDKKYNPNVKDEYAKNKHVHFISNRIIINWGGFSIVRTTLNLVQDALSSGIEFDYFILMSGQCFPIKSTRYIRNFIKKHQGRSFIEFFPLPDARLKHGGMDKFYYPVFFDQLGFVQKNNFTIKNKTFEPKKIVFKCLAALLRKTGYKREMPKGLTPCFGSQWWVLHQSAVRYVIEYIGRNPEICNFFKYTWAPDELFFQTILYNSPVAGDIEPKPLWYIDWSANGPPKTLSADDIDAILQSEALFARKFDDNKSMDILLKTGANT